MQHHVAVTASTEHAWKSNYYNEATLYQKSHIQELLLLLLLLLQN